MAEKNIEKSLVYVGTYSQSENESIFLYGLNNSTGELNFIKSFGGGKKPSYMVFDKSYEYLYAVNETENYAGKKSGAACAFSVDRPSGFISLLNRVTSEGQSPANIAISEDGRVILIANYKTGSVAVFPVEKSGILGKASDVIQHEGSGPDLERQSSAHTHFIIFSPDSRFVFAVDLGMDKIFSYHLNKNNGNQKLTNQATAFNSRPGTGPRQMCFHPNKKYAYLIHELKSTVAALSYDNEKGLFTEMQTIATIPENFSGENNCGGIKISEDGKYLYGSNRGHDSIVVFAVDGDNGRLSYVENVPSGGMWPREFTIDPKGNFLLAANQHSDNIASFKIDKTSGRLTNTGHHVQVEKPAFVQVVPRFE
ncbi:MAG: lactonase family protein [Ginsengibacter sp.]